MAVQAGHTGLLTWAEFETLRTHKNEITAIIDPRLVIAKLQAKPFTVPTSFLHWIQEADCTITEINQHLLCHFPFFACFNDFMDVLDDCGYKYLVADMFRTLMKLNTTREFVSKSTSGQRSGIHKFFRRLKSMVHDATFNDPRLFLRNLAKHFQKKMEQETDAIKKQILADQVVAIIGAEIDAHAITFDNDLTQNDIFQQMKDLTTETSNTITTEVIYYGRLANASSIAGNFVEGEEMMHRARCQASFLGQSLEIINMLYIEVYVLLWKFEKFPIPYIRDVLMIWGRIGLESLNDLEESDPDTKCHWRPMFIQRMVFCLLGIGNRANIIPGCEPDDNCLAEATRLLEDVERQRYNLETRRRMFYDMAWGRLYHLKNNTAKCLEHLKKAKTLAKEGKFKELKFISEFYQILSGVEGGQITEISPDIIAHDRSQGVCPQRYEPTTEENSNDEEDIEDFNKINLRASSLSLEQSKEAQTPTTSLNTPVASGDEILTHSEPRMMVQFLESQLEENWGNSPFDETEVKETEVVDAHTEDGQSPELENTSFEANLYSFSSQAKENSDEHSDTQKKAYEIGDETEPLDITQETEVCDQSDVDSNTYRKTQLKANFENDRNSLNSSNTKTKVFGDIGKDLGNASQVSQLSLKKTEEDSLTGLKVPCTATEQESHVHDQSETEAKNIDLEHVSEKTEAKSDLLKGSMSITINLHPTITDKSSPLLSKHHERTQDYSNNSCLPVDAQHAEMQTLYVSSFESAPHCSETNIAEVPESPPCNLASNQSSELVLHCPDGVELDRKSLEANQSSLLFNHSDQGSNLNRSSLQSNQSSQIELRSAEGGHLNRASLESYPFSDQYESGSVDLSSYQSRRIEQQEQAAGLNDQPLDAGPQINHHNIHMDNNDENINQNQLGHPLGAGIPLNYPPLAVGPPTHDNISNHYQNINQNGIPLGVDLPANCRPVDAERPQNHVIVNQNDSMNYSDESGIGSIVSDISLQPGLPLSDSL